NRLVAASSTAHGQSARTRRTPTHVHVVTRREDVPSGHSILRIRISTDAPTVTWPEWAALLLDRLRAPRCANNVIVMVAWEQQEGTTAGWNPLATTYDMSGATTYNSAGVRNYPSLEAGLRATLLTLARGWSAHGYGAIVRDLRACADPV